MEVYQLSRMVQRRGYRLEGPTMKHLATFDVLRGEEHIAQVSVYVLDKLQPTEIPSFLDRAVSIHHAMQHHRRCINCDTPLILCKNTTRAIEIFQSLTFPIGEHFEQVQQALQNAIVSEYRDARLGPTSDPLRTCPGCQIPLDVKSVIEIVDPEIPAIKAAFDFQSAMHQIQLMNGPNAADVEELQRKLLDMAKQGEA